VRDQLCAINCARSKMRDQLCAINCAAINCARSNVRDQPCAINCAAINCARSTVRDQLCAIKDARSTVRDQLCAINRPRTTLAIKSYLQALTIQTGQTREKNIPVKKMWQKKSLAKLQSDTLWRQELQKLQSMQSTIDSLADFCDMASKPKALINQDTKISDNVLALQRNITQKQQGQWQLRR
jgi:hypothetical protein